MQIKTIDIALAIVAKLPNSKIYTFGDLVKSELFLGDCLEKMKNIPDNCIDLILTDPPYKTVQGGRTGNKTPKGGIFSKHHEEFKRGAVFKENTILFSEWIPQAYRVLKSNSHCYIMSNGRNIKTLQVESEKAGFKYQNLLVWDKGNKTPNRYYMQQLEFILMLTKKGSRNINNMGTGNLLSVKNEIGKKLHPTQKPVPLLEIMIKNSTFENQVVLDMFMGSGSTGVACKNLNRNFIGIEKDKEYFEIAKKRIRASN